MMSTNSSQGKSNKVIGFALAFGSLLPSSREEDVVTSCFSVTEELKFILPRKALLQVDNSCVLQVKVNTP